MDVPINERNELKCRDILKVLYLEYTQCLEIPKKSFTDNSEDVVYQDVYSSQIV